jgi:hypothetical protein
MPAAIPQGTDMTEDKTMSMSVPTMALTTPPPASPMGRGRLKRKSQLMTDIPFSVM